MKNSEYSEEENNLTELSLGTSKSAKYSTTSTPRQTNLSSTEEKRIECPNPNPSSSVSSTNHSSNVNPFFFQPLTSFPLIIRPQINPIRNTSTLENPRVSLHTNLVSGPSSKHNFVPENAVDMGGNVSNPIPRRTRRVSSKGLAKGKSEIIPAPFPWATDRRAIVHSRIYLLQNNIRVITGKVWCKRCEKEFDIELDLEEKLAKLGEFVERKHTMDDRAPDAWLNPERPKCWHCVKENSVKPVIGKKKAINWLFLLLSQMLSFCTVSQLKYFCKHTNNRRTGAKDCLLYLTYMSLLKQLVPEWFS
ncbi:hypothetical protein Fmac_017001 [Flemingia macrophylla]|uniref:DUF7086 domain-containing protein n=1 Tax=Flemingia macrophylla TaxID=520843 RepID=A0ABD1MIY8_9FABA